MASCPMTGCDAARVPAEEVRHGAIPARQAFGGHSVRIAVSLVAAVGIVVAAQVGIADPKLSRAAMIAGIALVLWLFELIPLYATTLMLWVAMVLLLGPLDAKSFSITAVLSVAVNPVIVLFFGGFVLSVAGTKYGIDAYIAGWMLRSVRRSPASAIVITIAMGIAPSPATAVLVALGASMGVPFVISTPPNAMVYGQGILRPRDFLIPGMILMVLGCVLVAFAGPLVLRWAGVG